MFLTDAYENALEQQGGGTEWWTRVRDNPDNLPVTHEMMSEGVWFSIMNSMAKLDLQYRHLGTVSNFHNRQQLADKLLYQALVIQDLAWQMSRVRFIANDQEKIQAIEKQIEVMRSKFPMQSNYR